MAVRPWPRAFSFAAKRSGEPSISWRLDTRKRPFTSYHANSCHRGGVTVVPILHLRSRLLTHACDSRRNGNGNKGFRWTFAKSSVVGKMQQLSGKAPFGIDQ